MFELLKDVFYLRFLTKPIAKVGSYFIFMGQMFKNREKFMTYVRLFWDECAEIGLNSLVIVSIVSTFIGAVTCIQTAFNLVSPLIPKYTISLIVRDMTILELAPTITCIVLAGKVGSHIASGLGTMRITEQIDALEIMGINSISYLVLPKIVAAVFTIPFLVVLSAFLSIWGGYVAGTATGAITPQDYMLGLTNSFNPFNITFAIIKAVVFAYLIASIASFMGFYTKGGALEVGKASTAAVVASCIAVLVADLILAQLLL
jgi:phospholipid/cholesterol/gamma-HCH transport system permease protein